MTVATAERPAPGLGGLLARARFAASNAASEAFFATYGETVAHACHAMAARFQAGGRLLVAGERASRSDVAHVVVEFMHPVIVGKRALPAVALLSGGGDVRPGASLARLETLGRPGDMLMVMTDGALRDDEHALLASAAGKGVLTIALTGAARDTVRHVPAPRFSFAVPSGDACVVQEIHEMLYHVLWELVHVFLEHRAVRT